MTDRRAYERRVSDRGFELQLAGYGLTTARILYRMPDHPAILQTYVWQEYDLAPEFPELGKFLAFWRGKLEGPLHSIEVAHKRLVGAQEWTRVDGLFQIH